ncbi:MAG TPA: MarR family transcriptional regulator [Reyranella sp.]|jgi:DNA-binding MarR family transcriptional regulator
MARQPKTQPRTVAEYREHERASPTELQHSELIYSMYELSRLFTVFFDRAMARHHLTHSQWWTLMHIYQHEGSTQSDLAGILSLGRAAAGETIERLEKKGWIERRPDPRDSRVRLVFLSDAVVPVFELMTEEGSKLFKRWLSGVPKDDEAQLLAGLRRIKANAED